MANEGFFLDDDALVKLVCQIWPDDPGFLRTQWKDGIDIQVPTVQLCELVLRLTQPLRAELLRAQNELAEAKFGDCCRTPNCGGACTCEICAPDLTIIELRLELAEANRKLAEREWVRVEDRLPHERQVVLTYAEGYQEVAVYRHDNSVFNWETHYGKPVIRVSQWKPLDAPLPPPPIAEPPTEQLAAKEGM